MIIVNLEDIYASIILHFCENLAELGCPQSEKNPDMWFRYLSPKKQRSVASKLIDIEEKKYFQSSKMSGKKKSKSKSKFT